MTWSRLKDYGTPPMLPTFDQLAIDVLPAPLICELFGRRWERDVVSDALDRAATDRGQSWRFLRGIGQP